MKEQATNRPLQDKINVEDNTELLAWADRLNVTKVWLKAAINTVSKSAKTIEAYLECKKKLPWAARTVMSPVNPFLFSLP